jgi:SNF2 family DNA or RNA helicase
LYINEFVEMTPKQELIYREVSNAIQMNIDKIKASNNPLAELIRLRQATGYTGILSSSVAESAKFDRCEELIEEAVENGRKVVVFSNWTQITNPLAERLTRFNPVMITGETKDADRQFLVQQFQEVDSVKVAIGTTGAMGTGITLTAGTVVIFLDEPWTNAAKEQAIDRCHRIGTSDNITIYTIMVHNSIDERIHSIVEQKGEISDFMVDGKDITDKAKLVDFLLS